jgi:hypothetical protein
MHPESLLHAIISDNLLGNGHLPSIGARCLSYFADGSFEVGTPSISPDGKTVAYPPKDVGAAGGWKDVTTLLTCYQHEDEATTLRSWSRRPSW